MFRLRPKEVSLDSILANNGNLKLLDDFVSLTDIVYDRNKIETKKMDENIAYRYDVTIPVDIDKILKNNVVGVNVLFETNTNNDTHTNLSYNFYFIEDFDDKINLSKNDLRGLSELVKKKRVVLAPRDLSFYGKNNLQDRNILKNDVFIPTFQKRSGDGSIKDLINTLVLDTKDPQPLDTLMGRLIKPTSLTPDNIPGIKDTQIGQENYSLISDNSISNTITHDEFIARLLEESDETNVDNNNKTLLQSRLQKRTSFRQKIGSQFTVSTNNFLCRRIVEINKSTIDPDSSFSVKIAPIFVYKDKEKIGKRTLFAYDLKDNINLLKFPAGGNRIKILRDNPGHVECEFSKGVFTNNLKIVVETKNPNNLVNINKSIYSLAFSKEERTKVLSFDDIKNFYPWITTITSYQIHDGSNGRNSMNSVSVSLSGHKIDTGIVVDKANETNEEGNERLSVKNKAEGIEITVENILENITNIQLYRYDKSILSSQGAERKIYEVPKVADTFTFLDNDVIDGKIYEYSLYYNVDAKQPVKHVQTFSKNEFYRNDILESGGGTFSRFTKSLSSAEIERQSPDKEKTVKWRISQPYRSIEQGREFLGFTVNIDDSQDNLNITDLKRLFEEKQVPISLVEQSENDALKTVVPMILCNRKSIVSEHSEFVSVVPALSGEIIKDKTVWNNPEITDFFQYEFTLCNPSVAALINKKVSISSNELEEQGISNLIDYQKFTNASIKRRGVVSSPLAENSPLKNIVERFKTGETQYVKYDRSAPSITIDTIEMRHKILPGKKGSQLVWSTSSNTNKAVDYYIVFCNIEGNDNIVSVIKSGKDNTSYACIDYFFNNIFLEKSYRVVGIGYDGNIMTSSRELLVKPDNIENNKHIGLLAFDDVKFY